MKKIVVALLIVSLSFAQNKQKIGGGELNPGIYTNEKSIQDFQNLKIGVSIHWGPNSQAGEEISWSRGKETPADQYDQLYKTFNPTKYDANQWMSVFSDFGAKYIVVTTKHHDGFAMWHSDYSDYDIANTPFKRDYLKELADACKKKAIVFGTYYSTLDWFHPDYQPYGPGGPGKVFPTDKTTPNSNRYWIYAKNQIRELITKYDTKILQFDGDWDTSFTHNIGSDLYLYARKLNDKLIVNNRTDKGRYDDKGAAKKEPWNSDIYAGDFEERERLTTNFIDMNDTTGLITQIEMLGKSVHPWQAWVTLDKSQWSWKKNPKFITSQELIVDMLKTVGDGGNYLINVGPKADGTLEEGVIDILKKSGAWIKSHGNAIYGSNGGPFVKENVYTSTLKGKQIYLFVLDDKLETITVDSKYNAIKITDESNKPVMFSQSNGKLKISPNKGSKPSFATMYTITVK
jgi:alpha-L-fucosidase